jgi:threonine aldolase
MFGPTAYNRYSESRRKPLEMNFRSDNESPPPRPSCGRAGRQPGHRLGYAEDPWTTRLDAAFSDLFETRATVLPVSTGTVANSIALAAVTPPWGSVFCHRNAHILNDESGAPEFFGNGLRLVPVDGAEGRFTADALLRTIRATEGHGVHSYQASAVSLTQATESTAHRPGRSLPSARPPAAGPAVLDGARFGNAVAALGCHRRT